MTEDATAPAAGGAGAGQSARIRPAAAPGDHGWVVLAHGEAYEREFGWRGVESFVLRSMVDFGEAPAHPLRQGWIAERAGERLGCVFLEPGEDGAAVLRLLFVADAARGLGLGLALAEAATSHALAHGARAVRLWTTDVQRGARRIYAQLGYRHVASESSDEFGVPVTGETWELVVCD